jgi:DNA-binding protein H-NS
MRAYKSTPWIYHFYTIICILLREHLYQVSFDSYQHTKRKHNMAASTQTEKKGEAAPLNFATYSFSELVEIKGTLESEIQSRQAKEVEKLRSKVMEAAQTLGVSIEEMLGLPHGRRITKHARGKQPARYRGPHGEEWSGRGPAPRWMKPFLAQGKKKEDFLIK